MKIICKLFLAAVTCLYCAGTAIGAPTFEIDFHGADGLIQGEYDTNTDLSLATGNTVRVDVLGSGFDEVEGLWGWKLKLEYGSGLEAIDPEFNSNLWANINRDGVDNPLPYVSESGGYVAAQGNFDFFSDDTAPVPGAAEGEDILLFSFDLHAIDDALPSVLTLYDYDKGGDASDVSAGTLTLDKILDENGELLPLEVELATVNSSNPVPIPAAVWLLGSGLTGLFAYRRRQARK